MALSENNHNAGPLQLESRDHNFPKKSFILWAVTLKNARNRKSISKIPSIKE